MRSGPTQAQMQSAAHKLARALENYDPDKPGRNVFVIGGSAAEPLKTLIRYGRATRRPRALRPHSTDAAA